MFGARTFPGSLLLLGVVLVVPLINASLLISGLYVRSERDRLYAEVDKANLEMIESVEEEISIHVATLETLAAHTNSVHAGDQARELAHTSEMDFVLVDPSGMEIFDTREPKDEPVSFPISSEIVSAVLRNGNSTVSNLESDRRSSENQIVVAVPVIHEGRIGGVLASFIKPERLSEILQSSLPPGPFHATLLDSNGIIIARSPDLEHTVGRPHSALNDVATQSDGRAMTTNFEGENVFVHYRRVPDADWLVAASVDHAALTAPLVKSLGLLAVTSGVLLLVALRLAWVIGRKMIAAQQSLVSLAGALAAGAPLTGVKTSFEEADLVSQALVNASVSISEQAERLNRTNEELEQRIGIRTQQLTEKAAILETTINTMNQGLLVADAEGMVQICNVQACRILGLTDPLPVPTSLADILALAPDGATLAAKVAKASREQADAAAESSETIEWTKPDGELIAVRCARSSDMAGFVYTFTDITSARMHEHKIETGRLAAETANTAKSDFLATISHEIRTPLTAVIGYSEALMQHRNLPGKARIYAERIQNGGSAVLALVDELLDLRKIETGVIDLRTDAFSLSTVLEEAMGIVQQSARAKNIGLELRQSEDTKRYYIGDEDRLRQVLVNLLRNGVKFTHRGWVRLSVGSRTDEQGVHWLSFAVSDTGIGIAKSHQNQLFQRFHQIDSSLGRRFDGVGLGLAISKQLVERMGGTISVGSAVGRGSTFSFELPLETTRVGPTAEIIPRRQRHAGRVLVAEDVGVSQELIRELLESAGHTVELVSNGLEALEALSRETFDAVVMDLSMPVMDGLAATRNIRLSPMPTRNIPIVICTANIDSTISGRLKDAGANAYIRKPFRRQELVEALDSLLTPGVRPEAQMVGADSLPDSEDLREMVSMLGPDRVTAALDVLCSELAELSSSKAIDAKSRDRAAILAHSIISTAGLFDMKELVGACHGVERACRSENEQTDAISRFRAVILSEKEKVLLLRHVVWTIPDERNMIGK